MVAKNKQQKSKETSYNFREMKPIDPNELTFDLGFHIHALLKEETFFAKVSRYIKKVPVSDIPTAGVCLNPDTMSFELLYNPNFFLALTKPARLWVLMHEFYHISLGHCTDRRPVSVAHQKANIAMDEAINSLPNMIKDAPDFVIVPGRTPPKEAQPGSIAHIVKDHSPGQAMEYYLNQLPEDVEGDSFDEHGGWDLSDDMGEEDADAIREIAAHKMREVIQKAVDECDAESVQGSNSWGSISMEMRKKIKDGLKTRLDPKKVLAYFIKTSVRADRKHRITRINRRWPYIHPGRHFNHTANVAIAIDQSGSVDDGMLEQFFSWLNEFSKFATFTVIPFDDRVFEEKIYVWQKGQKRVKERVLHGGTSFDAPTDYVNDHEFDGLIICTDLCAPAPKRCKVQRMWITDARNAASPYLKTNERILVVDKKPQV